MFNPIHIFKSQKSRISKLEKTVKELEDTIEEQKRYLLLTQEILADLQKNHLAIQDSFIVAQKAIIELQEEQFSRS